MKKKLTYDIIFEIIFYILLFIYLIIGFIKKDTILLYGTVLTIITLMIPTIIMKVGKIKIPPLINFIIIGFIFISMFLAKVNNFYAIPNWDTFLHTLSGFLTFILGYMVFLYLNNYETKNINVKVIVVFCFVFAVSCAAFWEMWEFFTDRTFGLMAQVDLFDTMKDIITGSIFPLVMIRSLYKYLNGKKNRLYEDITSFMRDNNKK
ncbi:hypothetical protein [Clostridium tarantellae]|uniref:Membrane-spanning protein n=1 Tax=Clostridium tarantellae TaxID=39493 RepID=A0A6I1MSX5_9CLOT|nr:hypothetical protein [Clostridium tarantellae]MPQ45267.1 hypothetical protein [Clostridium tarantellae]